ncbi:hypothetical protein L484_019073 [Morus notabilis]|uniref:Uncharacterized protein n=1 Tax=Morus notabilis TaxID=981085 RepID=W9RR35_9ROSA|nr:hypothetical protein L484_019073 [Morus notabilis]
MRCTNEGEPQVGERPESLSSLSRTWRDPRAVPDLCGIVDLRRTRWGPRCRRFETNGAEISRSSTKR